MNSLQPFCVLRQLCVVCVFRQHCGKPCSTCAQLPKFIFFHEQDSVVIKSNPMLFPCKEGTPVLFLCSCSLQNRSCCCFFFRVFEASEGQREAGVEHKTRAKCDNFLPAFSRRVCLAFPARFALGSACLELGNLWPLLCTAIMESHLNRHVD